MVLLEVRREDVPRTRTPQREARPARGRVDDLDAAVSTSPDRTAIVGRNSELRREIRLTYAELGAQVDKIAAGLIEHGVGKGDVVAFQLPNWWEFTALFYACNRIGAVANPLMPMFRQRELRFMMGFSDAKVAIVPALWRGFDHMAMMREICPDLPRLRHVFAVGGKGEQSFEKAFLDITRNDYGAPIEAVDFDYARQLGCTIRQIARASAEDNGMVFAAVRPALVPIGSSFGRVEGSQNLVTVRGVFGGETSFSGSGAGGSPTAVAVVSDVLSVVKHAGAQSAVMTAAPTAMHEVSGDFVAPHYVRFTVNDKPGILAQITSAYAKYGINIEGVLQLPRFRKDRLPFVTTLEECPESVLDRALADVAQSDYHVQPPLAMPIFS